MATTLSETRRQVPQRLGRLLHPGRIALDLWSFRSLIAQLTLRELQQTWRESFLGALWMVLQPLSTLLVYTLVFTVFFAPRAAVEGETALDYVIYLFCGLIVYWAFSETVARAPALIVGQRSYVKNVVFPLQVLPVSILAAAFVHAAASTLLLLVVVALHAGTLSPTLWAAPLVFLPLAMISLGAAWILSSLGVFLRDVQQGMRAALQLLMYLTPVVWRAEWIPEHMRKLVLLNPLAGIVEAARDTLVRGVQPDWGALAYSTLFGVALLLGGHAWFQKTRWGFADVL